MKLLVFGSRNLTARHLPAMRKFIAAEAICTWNAEGRFIPLPLERILSASGSEELQHFLPDDGRYWEKPTLIHGDGPPGRLRGPWARTNLRRLPRRWSGPTRGGAGASLQSKAKASPGASQRPDATLRWLPSAPTEPCASTPT